MGSLLARAYALAAEDGHIDTLRAGERSAVPASHDLHGDGSVVIAPAPGHTTGSVVVFVSVRPDQRFAFIGDLAWQLDGITRGVRRPLLMRMLADNDSAQIRQDLARVTALAHHLRIVPAHDARGYDGIPFLVPDVDTSRAAQSPGVPEVD